MLEKQIEHMVQKKTNSVRTLMANSLKRISRSHLILGYMLLLSVVIFLGCTSPRKAASPNNLLPDEKVWLEKFFHDLLFVEGGVYTLWGSKPITEIPVYHYTDEEMNGLTANLPKEELEHGYIVDEYDFPENWEKWEAIRSKVPLKKFLLFQSHFSEDSKISYVYFVNILNAAIVMQDNYEIFKKEVGFDFHPLEVILKMPDSSSKFWIEVRKSQNASLLWGLLFGYGKLNASIFNWKDQKSSELCEKFLNSLPYMPSNPESKGLAHLSIDNFLLPPFHSFESNGETISKYQNERNDIIQAYKYKNFLEITLKELLLRG